MKVEVRHILIYALIAFTAFILAVLAFVPIPEGNRDMFIQTGASIIAGLSVVTSYYWGKTSKDGDLK